MSAAKGILFPALALMCWVAFLWKVVTLREKPRDPALGSLLVAFAVKGSAFLLATPGIAAAVDRRTGIPDLSALGIHLFGGVAFAAAVLVVLVHWSKPPADARQDVRRLLAAAGLIMVTMVGLWVANGLGTEHRSMSYLVQNAGRPLAAIYLCLYVVTLVVALIQIARLCLKSAASTGSGARPWLRRGLRMTGIGALIYSVNFWSRAFAVVGVHIGFDASDWEIVILLGAGLGMTLVLAGLTMPSWGPHLSNLHRWWGACCTCRRLHPLWRDLRDASPAIALHRSTRSLTNAHYRLYRRVIEIRDGVVSLRGYGDRAVSPQLRGPCGTARDDDQRAATMAAELKVALRAKAAGAVAGSSHRSGVTSTESLDGGSGVDLVSEAAWLTRVARAYARVPD
jgi:hypothetical protein